MFGGIEVVVELINSGADLELQNEVQYRTSIEDILCITDHRGCTKWYSCRRNTFTAPE